MSSREATDNRGGEFVKLSVLTKLTFFSGWRRRLLRVGGGGSLRGTGVCLTGRWGRWPVRAARVCWQEEEPGVLTGSEQRRRQPLVSR